MGTILPVPADRPQTSSCCGSLLRDLDREGAGTADDVELGRALSRSDAPDGPATLPAATTAAAACQAVVDALATSGLLASAYVEQGERLRCLAVRGYWQIYDGMPQTGVIGEAFRSGQRLLVREVSHSAHYLEAASSVVDELCVPLVVEGRVVGALNVESTERLTPEQEAVTDVGAAALSARLGDLELPRESPAQMLGRHAATLSRLAATVDGAALQTAVMKAALDLSGLSTAAMCLREAARLRVVAAAGPLAATWRGLPDDELEHIATWVETGTSSYTVGTREGLGFSGHEQLRSRGTGSLVALPLHAGGGGMVLVTSSEVVQLTTDVVELLELLASVVDSCLLIADSMRALRDRADADALTGLGHHAAFHARLPLARTTGAGQWLAVLYIDVDHFKAVNDAKGHAAGDQLLLDLADCMRHALRAQDRLFRIGGDEFAALAEVLDAEQAVALGKRLAEAVCERTGATLSVGVAVAESGETDVALLARADAAVYAAKARGRACVHLADSRRGTALG